MSALSPYQKFVHKSKYARWVEEKGRRENWEETVDRYLKFFSPRIPDSDRGAITKEIRGAIVNLDVMPSMRAMMTAGKALKKDNVGGYNCLRGTETFLTKDGVKTLLETVGTTQTVLSKDGTWVGAEIKSFGLQS